MGCKRSRRNSWRTSWSNSPSEHARDVFLAGFLNPRFWGMGNHLGPLPKASDSTEGQKRAEGAVGGNRPFRGDRGNISG